jgi:hypothetical protein
VACPCAFAIATPTAVTAGISNMAKRAILIKGGMYLELGYKLEHLVVDKTGKESCPIFLGKTKVVHVGFDDPPRLARATRTEAARLNCYRRVRDEIRRFVEQLPETLLNARYCLSRTERLSVVNVKKAAVLVVPS